MPVTSDAHKALYTNTIRLAKGLDELTQIPLSPFGAMDRHDLNDITRRIAMQAIRIGDLQAASIVEAALVAADAAVGAALAVHPHIDSGDYPEKTRTEIRTIFEAAYAKLVRV